MLNRKGILLGGLMALLAGAAVAQVPGLPLVFSGNELVRLTLTSGSTGNTTYNHLRNSNGYFLVAAGGIATSTPDNRTTNLIATGAVTTWNVSLPNTAYDGHNFCVVNSTAAAFTTNTTVTAPAGVQTQTLAVAYASQTLAANGGRACWLYAATNTNGSTGTWYRIL